MILALSKRNHVPSRKAQTEVTDTWGDVFDNVTLTKLPYEYIHTVLINFKDDTTWEITLTTYTEEQRTEFAIGFAEILLTYKESIDDIDIKIDTKKVKRDVKKAVKRIFKKLNL